MMVHSFNVDPLFKLFKQKKRNFNIYRYQAINEEVEKLLKAGFFREVHDPKLLANVVLVKKANGKWRVCIDFSNLNKSCPEVLPIPLNRATH